jgi:hypothetical protein
MFSKWRIVLLGLVVSQGSSIFAMEKNELANAGIVQKSAAVAILANKLNELSCSAEMRKKQTQMRENEKETTKSVCFGYPSGSGSSTPPEYYHGRRNIADMLKPVPYWSEFPGYGYIGR